MWKFNGKEKQDQLGLHWYDFHARQYDPQLGRFHGVDPMAGARSWVSPYNFVQNNPISRVDPTGMLDKDGEYIRDQASGKETKISNKGDDEGYDIIHTGKQAADGSISSANGNEYEIREIAGTSNKSIAGEVFNGSTLASGLGLGASVGSTFLNGLAYMEFGMSARQVVDIFDNGKFINHRGGINSQNFYGNQYINREAIKASKAAFNSSVGGLKVVGRGLTGLSLGTAAFHYAQSDKSRADGARLAGAFLITGSAVIPLIGPGISIGLGVADSFGAFDNIYNSFE